MFDRFFVKGKVLLPLDIWNHFSDDKCIAQWKIFRFLFQNIFSKFYLIFYKNLTNSSLIFKDRPIKLFSRTLNISSLVVDKLGKNNKKGNYGFNYNYIKLYKVTRSSRLSWLVAHPTIFRLFMKGKFDAHVLWLLAQRICNWRDTACDFTVLTSSKDNIFI